VTQGHQATWPVVNARNMRLVTTSGTTDASYPSRLSP
jgi:hypothetical protein